MRTIDRASRLTGVLAIATLALAACGGGTASTAPSTAAGTDAPASVAPESVAPTGGASAEPSSAIALPSFDLEDLVAGLEDIDSYKLTITVAGTPVYSATVVTRPVLSRDVTVSGQRFVIIGDEIWMETDGVLQPAPAEMAAGMLSIYDPVVLVGAFAQPGAMAGATEAGTEEKNGVQTKRYQITADSLIGTMASMPPGASIEIWVAEDGGYLVAMAVTGMESGDFAMDVTDVNDPANVVEPPE